MLPKCLAETLMTFQEEKKKNPHKFEEGCASQKQWMRNLLKVEKKKQFKLYIVLPSDSQSN